jgi:hypothetical protein
VHKDHDIYLRGPSLYARTKHDVYGTSYTDVYQVWLSCHAPPRGRCKRRAAPHYGDLMGKKLFYAMAMVDDENEFLYKEMRVLYKNPQGKVISLHASVVEVYVEDEFDLNISLDKILNTAEGVISKSFDFNKDK